MTDERWDSRPLLSFFSSFETLVPLRDGRPLPRPLAHRALIASLISREDNKEQALRAGKTIGGDKCEICALSAVFLLFLCRRLGNQRDFLPVGGSFVPSVIVMRCQNRK